MSTRCQIVTVSRDGELYPAKIYKHSDGYPEGVLPVLEPFADRFAESRGEDPEYLIAQCIRAFAFADLVGFQERQSPYYNPTEDCCGWGVSTFWHGDIEYLYIVEPSGRVRVCHPNMRGGVAPDRLPPFVEIPTAGNEEEDED